MDKILTWLFGPKWIVHFLEGRLVLAFEIVRAKSEFAAKWQAATIRKDDPRVGYLAWKWQEGLYLENESIEASKYPQ